MRRLGGCVATRRTAVARPSPMVGQNLVAQLPHGGPSPPSEVASFRCHFDFIRGMCAQAEEREAGRLASERGLGWREKRATNVAAQAELRAREAGSRPGLEGVRSSPLLDLLQFDVGH